MTEKIIDTGNSRLFYKVSGNGWPVVLLHGFAEDSDIWNLQQAELSAQYRLIIPDLPGSGRSDLVSNMSIEGLADSIKKILEWELSTPQAAGPAQGVIMIGHSMGGYITLAFAEKYPDILQAMGLFHSTAFADNEEKKTTRQRGIAFIQSHGSYEFVKQSTPNLFTEAYRIKNPERVSAMIDRYGTLNPLALEAYYRAMIQRPDRTAVLQSINKPVLFIIGKYDKAVPFEDSLKQCHMPDQAAIEILGNSAHMGMWEEREKSTAALLSFLADTTA
ncbi:MAG: alpha/beta hydrolase [Bacteroidota bacterium]